MDNTTDFEPWHIFRQIFNVASSAADIIVSSVSNKETSRKIFTEYIYIPESTQDSVFIHSANEVGIGTPIYVYLINEPISPDKFIVPSYAMLDGYLSIKFISSGIYIYADTEYLSIMNMAHKQTHDVIANYILKHIYKTYVTSVSDNEICFTDPYYNFLQNKFGLSEDSSLYINTKAVLRKLSSHTNETSANLNYMKFIMNDNPFNEDTSYSPHMLSLNSYQYFSEHLRIYTVLQQIKAYIENKNETPAEFMESIIWLLAYYMNNSEEEDDRMELPDKLCEAITFDNTDKVIHNASLLVKLPDGRTFKNYTKFLATNIVMKAVRIDYIDSLAGMSPMEYAAKYGQTDKHTAPEVCNETSA